LLLERYEASVRREDQTRAQFIADRVVEGVQECAVEVGIDGDEEATETVGKAE